jgi:hypothetical protein
MRAHVLHFGLTEPFCDGLVTAIRSSGGNRLNRSSGNDADGRNGKVISLAVS